MFQIQFIHAIISQMNVDYHWVSSQMKKLYSNCQLIIMKRYGMKNTSLYRNVNHVQPSI